MHRFLCKILFSNLLVLFLVGFLGGAIKASPPFPAFKFEDYPDLEANVTHCHSVCQLETLETPKAVSRITPIFAPYFPNIDLGDLIKPALDEKFFGERGYLFDNFMTNLRMFSSLASRIIEVPGSGETPGKSYNLLKQVGVLKRGHISFVDHLDDELIPSLEEMVATPSVLPLAGRLEGLSEWLIKLEELYSSSKTIRDKLQGSLYINSSAAGILLLAIQKERRIPSSGEIASIERAALLKQWTVGEIARREDFIKACEPVVIYIKELKKIFLQRESLEAL